MNSMSLSQVFSGKFFHGALRIKNKLPWEATIIVLLLFTGLAATSTAAELDAFVGDWHGSINLMGQELEVSVFLEREAGDFRGTMDIPAQGALGIPLDEIRVTSDAIGFALAGIPGDPMMDLVLANGKLHLEGTFSQSGASFPAHLQKDTAEAQEAAAAAQEQIRNELIQTLQPMLERWDVPGAAIGVIQGDEIILAQGFGYADLNQGLPVTANTVFAIGSSTKAFTTASVALMIEEGKLSWDQQVLEAMPAFRLNDAHATQHVTLRDLALHRSGMARHDFSWYGRNFDRSDAIASVRYLEPAAELRETFIYNNHGYTILGQLAADAAGMEWEDLVQERLLDPLGMTSTSLDIAALQNADNHARPYQLRQGELSRLQYRNLDAMAPAGSINSTVTDMLAWVRMYLQQGSFAGEQILSATTISELTRPQLALPAGGFSELRFSNYALGWMVDDYRGDVFIHHGGNIDGYSALMAMVPSEELGIVVLSNLNNTSFPTLAAFHIIDALTGRDPIDWSGRLQVSAGAMPEDSLAPPRQIPNTQPSRSLEQYAGPYVHPGYGQVQVEWLEEEEKLQFAFREQTAILEHLHYDVFTARIQDMAVGINMAVHFLDGSNGHISGLTLPLDASVAPILFSLAAGPELSEHEYLEAFVGHYELMGMTLAVEIQGDQLVLMIPGQTPYPLLAQQKNRFVFAALEGFSVEFDMVDGAVTNMWLNQPTGSFSADRL